MRSSTMESSDVGYHVQKPYLRTKWLNVARYDPLYGYLQTFCHAKTIELMWSNFETINNVVVIGCFDQIYVEGVAF